ncbi:hypothetical protein JW978_03360 [Candidatus Dojkabacteria bacterium]|nr:hypothetical protein [Candidatus Dojkabacteria bacterium]
MKGSLDANFAVITFVDEMAVSNVNVTMTGQTSEPIDLTFEIMPIENGGTQDEFFNGAVYSQNTVCREHSSQSSPYEGVGSRKGDPCQLKITLQAEAADIIATDMSGRPIGNFRIPRDYLIIRNIL